jgi:hypothetical protein
MTQIENKFEIKNKLGRVVYPRWLAKAKAHRQPARVNHPSQLVFINGSVMRFGHRAMKPFLVVLILFSAFLTALAQTKASAITEIDTYIKEIDRFIKTKPKSRLFGDLSTTDKSRWREVRAKQAEDLYEKAEVWSRKGKVVAANFALSSPSGDWVHFITYYFRADGSLAKIEAQLNTFYGNVSVLRDRYYDGNRKQLKATERFLDLETQKPIKRPEFNNNSIPFYSRVSTLPFGRLL